jgi:eukaryotic-like serine/threonine-protein kinase
MDTRILLRHIKLNHPNIATLYSFFRDGDQFVMVMEFVQGHTLARLIRNTGRHTPQRAIDIISQTLSALQHAHEQGILHRDIKPDNILLNEQGKVKITDFGIARVLGSARLTRDSRLVGTLEYLAPERVKGLEGDCRSDLYSAGAVLYELLTGHLPFEQDTDFELMRAQLEELPPPLRQWTPEIPEPLESLVFRAMAKKQKSAL